MSPESAQPETQRRILRTATILHHLRPDWHGALILNLGLDPQGAAVSFAATVLGAVCLSLEYQPDLLRNAQRSGSCDFLVNTLDEAIRAMKNEIRKHKPLSVGLEGDPVLLIDEILERGLAPQLFSGDSSPYPRAATALQSLGAVLLNLEDRSAADLLDTFLATHPWQLQTFSFPNTAHLRAFDARALELLPPDSDPDRNPADHFRRQWLLAAPRLLPRDRHRTLWLTPEEHRLLSTAS